MNNFIYHTIKISEASQILCEGYIFELNHIFITESYVLYQLDEDWNRVSNPFCFDTEQDAIKHIYQIINNR